MCSKISQSTVGALVYLQLGKPQLWTEVFWKCEVSLSHRNKIPACKDKKKWLPKVGLQLNECLYGWNKPSGKNTVVQSDFCLWENIHCEMRVSYPLVNKMSIEKKLSMVFVDHSSLYDALNPPIYQRDVERLGEFRASQCPLQSAATAKFPKNIIESSEVGRLFMELRSATLNSPASQIMSVLGRGKMEAHTV